ncbi:MAG: MoxR family ATPase [Bacillota bacterium]|nr:MoxR family ATPase [Bacillota bacterium]
MEINENEIQQIVEKVKLCEEEISKGIIGQKDIIRQVIIAVLCGGNVLLEGVPGLGKTQLVKTISKVLDLSFSRIQFTPDLMPADVVGTNLIVKEGDRNVFQFEKGPIFANLVLADEINRATPKTQSALLEAMQEKTVTVGKVTHKLAEPFMVLATQNPIENEGTYPLPEAQLDRFLFKLNVQFPSLEELMGIMDITVTNKKIELEAVVTGEEILKIREIIREVPMAEAVKEYALKLIIATHPEVEAAPEFTKKYVSVGSSPRGAQAIFNAARVRAVMEGRFNVSFDDVKAVAYPALRHRVFLNFEGTAEGITPDQVISRIIEEIRVV